MRKTMFVALFMVMGLATTSFAADAAKVAPAAPAAPATTAAPKEAAAPKGQVIKGVISAINVTANQITLKQDETKKVLTITVTDIASLKEGMHVKVTLKAGSADQAESVKVLKHKAKK